MLYQPRIKDPLIRKLYFRAKREGRKMTHLFNEALEDYLYGEPDPPIEGRMSKIYTGRRENNTVIAVEVITHQGGNKVRKQKLRHIPFHSATKGDLNWGYGGSGPADLALAILVDYFKERAPSEGYRARAEGNNWMVKSTAWKLHQDFKWHFVATFADEWELYDSQIAAWLKEQEEQWQEC
jgi:Family of unknown function (DUF6166)